MPDPAGDDLEQRCLVDGGKDAPDIQLERPRRPPAVDGDAPKETHQPIARRQRPLALAAGVGVVDEEGLEHPLLGRHQEVVDHAIPEVRGKHLARLGTIGHKTDRRARAVAVVAEVPLECQQLRLGVDLNGQSTERVPFVAAAYPVLPPQRTERIQVTADHEPPRTARTKLALFLLSLFTLPLLKFTFHAFAVLAALVVASQLLNDAVAPSACSRHWRTRALGPAEAGENTLELRPLPGLRRFAPSRRRERDLVIMARPAWLAPRASLAGSGHGPDADFSATLRSAWRSRSPAGSRARRS